MRSQVSSTDKPSSMKWTQVVGAVRVQPYLLFSFSLHPIFPKRYNSYEICGDGRCQCLPTSLVRRVLQEVFGGCSTVQDLSSFFANIKEGLMIAPVVYVIAGSCGVALLRRSGDTQACWRAVLKAE